MAVSCANIINSQDTVDRNSYNTASITPVANRLYILTVSSKTEITANPNVPTVTGAGLTWVQVDTGVYDNDSSSRRRITSFRALGASPSTGALTIDCGGQTQVQMDWILDEFQGIDTGGTNGSAAIVQTAQTMNVDTSSATNTPLATLAAFSSASNATYGVIAEGNATDNITVGSGFTQIGVIKDSSLEGNIQMKSEFNSGNDTTVDFTFNVTTVEFGVLAMEIKVAPSTFNQAVASQFLTFF